MGFVNELSERTGGVGLSSRHWCGEDLKMEWMRNIIVQHMATENFEICIMKQLKVQYYTLIYFYNRFSSRQVFSLNN